MEPTPSPVPFSSPSPVPTTYEEVLARRQQLDQLLEAVARFRPLIEKHGAQLHQDVRAVSQSPNWSLWVGAEVAWFFLFLVFKHGTLKKLESLPRRFVARVLFFFLFWGVASLAIPMILFGEPYVRILSVMWDVLASFWTQKL
jgi:hypothetical protein